MTDQNGKVTSYAYDDADRLVSVTDAQTPTRGVTQYGYDTEGDLISITDALNRVTSFSYDKFRRVKQTTFPSTLIETYTYDGDDNLQTKTDRNGNTITYVYDNLNRMTSKQYPGSGGSVSYTNDLANRLTQVSDSTGTYGFGYDNMGRLIGTTTQYSFLPGNTYTNSYTYDTLNRLSTLTNSLTGQFGFGYDALSHRTSLTRPNGVNTSYSYDSLSRLLSVLHQSGATTIDGASYTLDSAGNRTSKVNQLNGVTENYSYDPIYQLTQVQQVVNGNTSTTESYTYDAVGNRLSSQNVASYSYNNSNQLTSSSDGYNYTYDANGNILTKSNASGTTQFAWDGENRLTSVTLPNGGGTVSYRYDPFGNRVQKSGPNGTTNYVYDGQDVLEEVDTSGNVVARYTHGTGIDEQLAQFRASTTSYYHQDGINSVTAISNAASALTETYTFNAFGKLTASTGTLTNPYQYTGREFDSETGLYFNRTRYFDLATGRWLNEDPLQFAAGMDFYEYSYNNPAMFNDPSGLQAAPAPVPPPPGLTVIAGGGGAAAGGASSLLTGGLITLDAGLLAYDSYELYKLGVAYDWWQPFLNSGNMQQLKNPARAKCQSGCPPCVPPVGSLRHRVDQVPPSRPHKPWPGTHWHIEQMQQAPAPACTCFWKEIANGQGPVPPGVPHQ